MTAYLCIAKLDSSDIGQCSDGELKSLFELREKIILLHGGATLTVAQILRISYGQFDGDDNDFTVCNFHEEKCIRKAKGTKNRNCAMPKGIVTHPGKLHTSQKPLPYEYYRAIFKHCGIRMPVGKSVCVDCRKAAATIVGEFEAKQRAETEAALTAATVQRREEIGYGFRESTIRRLLETKTSEVHESGSSQSSSSDRLECSHQSIDSPRYLPASLTTAIRGTAFKDENTMFKEFAASAGVHNLRIGRKTFNEMDKKGQIAHIGQAKAIFEEVLRHLCPDSPQELWNAVIDKEIENRTEKLVQTMVDAYLELENSSHKRQLLSLLTTSLSFTDCQVRIPGLSKSTFYRAKAFAKEFGAGAAVEIDRDNYIRYNTISVEHFINYMLSFNVVSDMPFGDTKMKLSSGEELVVPNVIRDSVPERIIRQYRAYCNQEIECGNLLSDFVPLQRTTLLEILKVCKASKRKALQGLDYFTAAGGNAFDSFISVVKDLFEKGHISNDWRQRMTKEFRMAKNYLKFEYKGHLSMHSHVPAHCIVYALSDPMSNEFSTSCVEDHNAVCSQCETLPRIMEEVMEAVNRSTLLEIEKSDLQFQIDNATRDINLWKSHKLRVINQDLARRSIIQQMIPGQSAFIVMDWAMKLLPAWYREDTNKFFGKRGLPWHVTVVTMKNDNETFSTRTFLHVFNQCKQDSDAVLAILRDTLQRLKTEMPLLESVYLRSDNAGCYHSAQTLLSLPATELETGIQIKRFDFSDPQGGKAECDRMSATVKRHINMFVAEKHNCTNGNEFVDAVESHNGIPGVSIHYGTLESSGSLSKKPQILGISSLFNFEYEGGKIRAWKAFEIGAGKEISNERTEISTNCRFVEKYGTRRPAKWRRLDESRESLNEDELMNELAGEDELDEELIGVDDEVNIHGSKLFACQKEGCTKEYNYEAHLERHCILGSHEYIIPKVPLKDFAMKLYKTQLQDVERVNIFGEFSTSPSASIADQQAPLPSGWALKQEKRIVRFSKKQRKFLMQKYQEGETTMIKYTPEQVAKMMRTETTADGKSLFTKDEFLNRNQIFSYFCRLVTSKRLAEGTNLSIMDLIEVERDERAMNEHMTICSIRQAVNHQLQFEQSSAVTVASDSEAKDQPSTSGSLTRLKRQSRKRVSGTEPAMRSKR